jgi:putative flippase GtrA
MDSQDHLATGDQTSNRPPTDRAESPPRPPVPPYRERVYDESALPAPPRSLVSGPGRRILPMLLSRAFRRFAVVGVVNTAIDVALFALLNAPLGVLVANFVSTSAGMTFSFLVNGRFTFEARRPTLRHAVLFVAANGSTMWVLQPLLITLAHDTLAAPMMVAKLAGLGVSVVANFLLYRYVVWPERASEPDEGGLGVSPRTSSKRTAEPATP